MKTNSLPQFSSVDEVLLGLLQSTLKDGDIVTARRMKTLEIYPTGFILTNPRARCITNKVRKWSLPLAIGEFAWHLSASNDVNFISYYAKRWKSFSEDGKTIKESCYGYKMFNNDDKGLSPWNNIVNLLKEDPATRRAVLSLYTSSTSFDAFSKDVSCICTVQFLIRDNKLEAITHMRSNDIMWGMPYDIFLITMLQEYLAKILYVDLGYYYHFANSMHLYERHFEIAENILESDYDSSYKMPPMSDLEQIPSFIDGEQAIRTGEVPEIVDIADYWRDLLRVLQIYRMKKNSLEDDELIPVPSHYSEFIGSEKHVVFNS